MLMKRNGLALLLGLCLSASALAATDNDRPPVADKMVAFSGEQGIKVSTLRVGERAANEALVMVDGIDHDWQRKIQKMHVEKTSRDTRYSTQVNGKPYVVLIVNGNYGELYLPGETRELRVGYDASLSEQTPPQHFLTDYLEQAAKP